MPRSRFEHAATRPGIDPSRRAAVRPRSIAPGGKAGLRPRCRPRWGRLGRRRGPQRPLVRGRFFAFAGLEAGNVYWIAVADAGQGSRAAHAHAYLPVVVAGRDGRAAGIVQFRGDVNRILAIGRVGAGSKQSNAALQHSHCVALRFFVANVRRTSRAHMRPAISIRLRNGTCSILHLSCKRDSTKLRAGM